MDPTKKISIKIVSLVPDKSYLRKKSAKNSWAGDKQEDAEDLQMQNILDFARGTRRKARKQTAYTTI